MIITAATAAAATILALSISDGAGPQRLSTARESETSTVPEVLEVPLPPLPACAGESGVVPVEDSRWGPSASLSSVRSTVSG